MRNTLGHTLGLMNSNKNTGDNNTVGAHYLLINPHYLTLEIHIVHSIIHARVHVPFSTWGYLSSTQTNTSMVSWLSKSGLFTCIFYLHSLYIWPHTAGMQPSMAITSLPQLFWYYFWIRFRLDIPKVSLVVGPQAHNEQYCSLCEGGPKFLGTKGGIL